MARKSFSPASPPAPAVDTIEGTRYYLGAMLATLKDCGHKGEHVRQAMYEFLGDKPIDGGSAALSALRAEVAAPAETSTPHPNHLPDLRYVLATLERALPVHKKDKALREQVEASINGMRYIISRSESEPKAIACTAAPAEGLTDAQIEALWHSTHDEAINSERGFWTRYDFARAVESAIRQGATTGTKESEHG